MSLISNDNSWKASVNSVCSVRERTTQRVTCVSSFSEGAFYFSQIYTEEQNTQGFTETLSQPISQNLTATFSSNALCALYAEGVLWARNSAPKGSVNSVCSVREKNILCERRNFPRHFSNVLFLTENTEEQNTQGPTETLSQPITQNVTATFSSNALWTLYAEGLLCARNCAQNAQWTLCALWEKIIPTN